MRSGDTPFYSRLLVGIIFLSRKCSMHFLYVKCGQLQIKDLFVSPVRVKGIPVQSDGCKGQHKCRRKWKQLIISIPLLHGILLLFVALSVPQYTFNPESDFSFWLICTGLTSLYGNKSGEKKDVASVIVVWKLSFLYHLCLVEVGGTCW